MPFILLQVAIFLLHFSLYGKMYHINIILSCMIFLVLACLPICVMVSYYFPVSQTRSYFKGIIFWKRKRIMLILTLVVTIAYRLKRAYISYS